MTIREEIIKVLTAAGNHPDLAGTVVLALSRGAEIRDWTAYVATTNRRLYATDARSSNRFVELDEAIDSGSENLDESRMATVETVRGVLNTLSPTERLAAEMLADGYEWREIQDKTGLSRTSLYRFIRRLRERLSAELEVGV